MLKKFPNETFILSVASVPKVILVMNRNYIIDTKYKSND